MKPIVGRYEKKMTIAPTSAWRGRPTRSSLVNPTDLGDYDVTFVVEPNDQTKVLRVLVLVV
jgi:hypothetical protein